MALEPYTPDPVAGAATDALGVINRFNDQEPVRSLIANFPDEQIIDWVAYLRGLLLALTAATAPFNKHTPKELSDTSNDSFDLDSQVCFVEGPVGFLIYYYDSTVDAPDGFEWTIGIYGITIGNEVSIRRDPPGSPTQPIITVPGPAGYLTVRLFKADGRIYLGPFSTDGSPSVISP